MKRRRGTRTFFEAGRTLTLHDRGTHHELMIEHVPLLSSAVLGTERAFGALAARFATREDARVLVGGLGFGATLAGALEALGPRATVLVSEKLSTVVKLVQGELSAIAGEALQDPRAVLLQEDVVDVIARERDLDAILLDVDNGPEWASFPANERLYDRDGLRAAKAALRRGGAYAVWSGYPADAFVARLGGAGLLPSVIPLREKGRVQARVYVGVRR